MAGRGDLEERAGRVLREGERAREGGQLRLAEQFLSSAVRMCQESHDLKGEAHALGQLGITFVHAKRPGEAERCLVHSLTCAAEAKDPGAEAIALRHLGSLRSALATTPEQHEKAITDLRMAQVGAPGSRAHRGWFRHGLAGAYFRSGRRLPGVWHWCRGFCDLVWGWHQETDQFKKRNWLLGFLLDVVRIPVLKGRLCPRLERLAVSWQHLARAEQVRELMGLPESDS